MADNQVEQKAQTEIAVRLQRLLLEDFERAFKDCTITAADRATLARLLMQNGWSLDPKELPQGLRDKLTTHFKPTDFDEDDGVVGQIGAA
jgi:hypothetical protein